MYALTFFKIYIYTHVTQLSFLSYLHSLNKLATPLSSVALVPIRNRDSHPSKSSRQSPLHNSPLSSAEDVSEILSNSSALPLALFLVCNLSWLWCRSNKKYYGTVLWVPDTRTRLRLFLLCRYRFFLLCRCPRFTETGMTGEF